MDPTCSHSKQSTTWEPPSRVTCTITSESKTENQASMLEKNTEDSPLTVKKEDSIDIKMEPLDINEEYMEINKESCETYLPFNKTIKEEPLDEPYEISIKQEPIDTDTEQILFPIKQEPVSDDTEPCNINIQEGSHITVKEEKIDEIEREDFEEENRILQQCSDIMVDANKIKATAHFSGNLSSANSSLASSSETISTLSHLAIDSNMPGCSKSEECEDSNSTIRKMIRTKAFAYIKTEDPPKVDQPIFKNDFMKNLLNSGPSSVAKVKHEYKGKLYKGEEMEELEVGESGEFSVASTSNADRLLGLVTDADGKTRPISRKSSPVYPSYDDDSDEEANRDSWCTCLSSHEDDEESESEEEDQEDRLWQRKRRYGGEEPLAKSPPVKRQCTENSSGSCSSDNDWPPNLPGTSIPVASANVPGPPGIKQWLNSFQSWSNGEKIQAIDALISRCGSSQVRHMMKAIEPLFQRDFISLLPKELALTVLGYLMPQDLLRAAQTCHYWRFLADDNLLWKEQCRRIGITTLKRMPRSLPRCASPWKTAYMRQYLIENNWLFRPVNQPIVMRGHDDHVITCLQFYGNRILSGSDDTTLKIWSAVTGKCLRTLVGHSGGVWSSQMVDDLVISGSTDRTLRVWSAKTGQCLKVLAGHTSTVRCMHLHHNRVVSGSRDATLRVWSIPDGRCLRVLVGHLAAVRCVQYDGKVVVSGAYDYFVKVWNPLTGECLHTLAGHSNRVYSLQFDGVHVVSGSLDTSIRVWDVESGQLKHTLTGHQSLTSGMELHSNILVSGNADSTVKVWDITTGHCLHTLSGPNKHQSAVTCLQSSNRFVITSSDDGTVKLWDVRTGEFIRNLVQLSSGGSGGVVWRIRASATKLICAVGSRNGTEETKLLVLDFDVPGACRKCNE